MTRYQYKIVNLGTFNAMERMLGAFADLGADGWQLVATYDKASNWFQGREWEVVHGHRWAESDVCARPSGGTGGHPRPSVIV